MKKNKYKVTIKGYAGFKYFKNINYLRDWLCKELKKNVMIEDLKIVRLK